jgi:N-acylneuraminate cytidylyltransferase/CMP-N,N'-diacetyllegionaminic acid synthase
MIEGKSVLAIIPARGGSKGLPRKNIVSLCGKPLIAWPIQAAKQSAYVDKVVVSTDDSEIADMARQEGAEVPFLRPSELATDTATSISVIEHVIDFLSGQGDQFDYCVFLEPTSPLTEADDVNKALHTLNLKREIADAIVGVSRVISSHPVFDVTIDSNGLIRPFLANGFSSPTRRQDLNKLYFFEGSLYISDTAVLLKQERFYHERTLAYVVPKWKAFEIDDIVDFICVEAIMKNMERIKKNERTEALE